MTSGTQGCVPSGAIYLCMSTWFKCSLTWSSSTQVSLAPDYVCSQITGTAESAKRPVLPVKTKAKKVLSISLLHITCHEVPSPYSVVRLHFPALSFTADRSFSCWPLARQVLLKFGFPRHIPARMDSVTIFFLCHLALHVPLAHCLLISEYCQELLLPSATFT